MDKDIELKIIEEEFPPIILDSVKSKREGKWHEFRRGLLDDAFLGISSYFTLAYLSKHPKTPVSRTVIANLYSERYHGFSYISPDNIPVYEELKQIYQDVYNKRDLKADAEIIDKAPEKNKRFIFNFKK